MQNTVCVIASPQQGAPPHKAPPCRGHLSSSIITEPLDATEPLPTKPIPEHRWKMGEKEKKTHTTGRRVPIVIKKVGSQIWGLLLELEQKFEGWKSKGDPQILCRGPSLRTKEFKRFWEPVLHKHLNSYTISKDLIVLEPFFSLECGENFSWTINSFQPKVYFLQAYSSQNDIVSTCPCRIWLLAAFLFSLIIWLLLGTWVSTLLNPSFLWSKRFCSFRCSCNPYAKVDPFGCPVTLIYVNWKLSPSY